MVADTADPHDDALMWWPFSETVTVSRPSGTDRYGDPLPATEHSLVGVFAPGSSGEATDREDQVTSLSAFYVADLNADVTAVDRLLRADGTRWQVAGDPERFSSPFVPAGVCAVHMERITG